MQHLSLLYPEAVFVPLGQFLFPLLFVPFSFFLVPYLPYGSILDHSNTGLPFLYS